MERTFKQYYDKRGVLENNAFQGVDQMLADLNQRGHRLFVAANKRLVPTIVLIEYFSWCDYFSGIYSLDSFGSYLKDKAALLKQILEIHSLVNADTIYIGDRSEDSIAALDNELTFLHAAWGYTDSLKESFDNISVLASDIHRHLS